MDAFRWWRRMKRRHPPSLEPTRVYEVYDAHRYLGKPPTRKVVVRQVASLA